MSDSWASGGVGMELLTFLTVNRSARRKVVGLVAEVILHMENIWSRYTLSNTFQRQIQLRVRTKQWPSRTLSPTTTTERSTPDIRFLRLMCFYELHMMAGPARHSHHHHRFLCVSCVCFFCSSFFFAWSRHVGDRADCVSNKTSRWRRRKFSRFGAEWKFIHFTFRVLTDCWLVGMCY